MRCFRKIGFIILIMTLLISCKRKKASLSGEDPVEMTDFIESFNELRLPYEVTDSIINKKENDSLLISYKVFTQFVPDSILTKVFGKTKPKMYPMGRVESDKKETYLLAKGVQGNKKVAFIICYDKDNEFVAAMPLLQPDQYVSTQQVSGIDKKYSVYKTILRKNTDGSFNEGKEVYVSNADAKDFTLILTDALDEKATELINPIDTFQKKNKYSADYVKNKKNIVSIRDGKKPGRFTFFVHIEKNEGDCTGELKSEAQFTSASTGVYSVNGDPCMLQFTFTSSSVTLKEIEGCGARRGLKCTFDGSFTRKKEPKPKTGRKKTSSKR